jgi:hypothetical protein
MDSILAPISSPRSRARATAPAPLRRSMPAPAEGSRLRTALLAITGLVVFVDIEFALAYLLYFAVQAAG